MVQNSPRLPARPEGGGGGRGGKKKKKKKIKIMLALQASNWIHPSVLDAPTQYSIELFTQTEMPLVSVM
jgi:hypothetical protein